MTSTIRTNNSRFKLEIAANIIYENCFVTFYIFGTYFILFFVKYV